MADAAAAIEAAESKADAVTRPLAWPRELRRPHLRDRLRFEQLPIRSATAGEERADKAGQVGDGGVHAPRWRDTELKGRRGERAPVERPHCRWGQVPRQRRRRLEAGHAHA